MPRPKVSERVSKFKEIFLAKPPLVSGTLSLDASNYLLYYVGPQNPRCVFSPPTFATKFLLISSALTRL